MAQPQKYSFGIDPVGCHSWSHDRSSVAMSPNNSEVYIYQKRGSDWVKKSSLCSHAQRVTGIDWDPNNNRIVTCAADRNAYVWNFEGGEWKQGLVILRINRAATCVKWSHGGTKFAVGSASRLISVCYFESENVWWVSKHVKKNIKSTVTSIDWHPDDVLLAAGSTDFKCRVYSAYIKEVEPRPNATCWGKKMTFGNLMQEFTHGIEGGWVHSVNFSSSGDKLAWVGHDSSISVVDGNMDMKLHTIRHSFLPFLSCVWATEDIIITAGHDCCPIKFRHDTQGIQFVEKLDGNAKTDSAVKFTAMKRFQQLDHKAQESDTDTKLHTIHQKAITQVLIHTGNKRSVSKYSTIGNDGLMCVWDLK